MQHRSRTLFTLLALACVRTAHAFSAPEAFHAPANEGGGGGRWFSGSPAEGYACDVCHTPEPKQTQFGLRVSGLPSAGYVAGTSYDLTLEWPEFAQRWHELIPDPTRPASPDAPVPSIGLVAELVAESGLASGAIEIDATNAAGGDLCERVRANLAPRLAAKLVQNRPGIDALELRPNDRGLLRCEARQLGQRCLVALSACGATRVRLRWIAPAAQEGPIWFSAGFVASEAASGTPVGDSVDTVSVPIVPQRGASERYRSTLGSSCAAVSGVGSYAAGASWLMLLVLALARMRRTNVALRVLAAAGIISIALLCGCVGAADSESTLEYPQAGLYTPGNTLGASDPTDSLQTAPPADRCKPAAGDPAAEDAGAATGGGTLRVEYSTQPTGGTYAPKNCGATWIENAAGDYVATLEIRARLRRPSLAYYRERACDSQPGPDIMASATTPDHTRAHVVMWSGRDFAQRVVPDGTYTLFIEATETDRAPGQFEGFEFAKGPEPFDVSPPVSEDGPVRELRLNWKPGGRGLDAR